VRTTRCSSGDADISGGRTQEAIAEELPGVRFPSANRCNLFRRRAPATCGLNPDVLESACSTIERTRLPHPISEETRYRLLKYLSEHPGVSQRELARELGVSVGKINYCLKALMEKGLLKIRNFRQSNRKSAYSYVLTPKGIEEKVSVTYAFLRYKLSEYAVLKSEIDTLMAEIKEIDASKSIRSVAGPADDRVRSIENGGVNERSPRGECYE
jgi:EPS-associated MarR family transcriptional regulator